MNSAMCHWLKLPRSYSSRSSQTAEKAVIIVTTNLPFSEWPQVFTNARPCKAVLNRLTGQAHIIGTGSESYRFRRTRSKEQKQSSSNTTTPA